VRRHQQPSLTKKKLRRLKITAGAPKYSTTSRGIWSSDDAMSKPAARNSGAKGGRERDTGARMK
jgi:hypothetical protein